MSRLGRHAARVRDHAGLGRGEVPTAAQVRDAVAGALRPVADRDSLLAELAALEAAVAVPDKVFMPAGWSPVAHRARHAAAFFRIDELRERLGLCLWQRPWSTAPAFGGMPRAKHRELVRSALLDGRTVPPEVVDSHPGLAEEVDDALADCDECAHGWPACAACEEEDARVSALFDEERRATGGASECIGSCSPACVWCLVDHACPDDCGGGDACPYVGLSKERVR